MPDIARLRPHLSHPVVTACRVGSEWWLVSQPKPNPYPERDPNRENGTCYELVGARQHGVCAAGIARRGNYRQHPARTSTHAKPLWARWCLLRVACLLSLFGIAKPNLTTNTLRIDGEPLRYVSTVKHAAKHAANTYKHQQIRRGQRSESELVRMALGVDSAITCRSITCS